MSNIYPFSLKGATKDEEAWERVGKRGVRAFELAEMGLPVVPGFVIDCRLTGKMEAQNVGAMLKEGLPQIEEQVGRKYGDADKPLILKVVCSSNLNLPIYPTVFNVGLSPTTMPGFAAQIGGEDKAWFEYCYLLRTAGTKLFDLTHDQFDAIEQKHEKNAEGLKSCAAEMLELVGKDNLPDEPLAQLESIIKAVAKKYHDPELEEDDDIAVLVQAMVFGNIGEDASVGMFNTRDIISGEARLEGSYLYNSYTLEKKGEDIHTLKPEYLDQLKKIAHDLEVKFREIREVKFIVEDKKLWLINQTEVEKKSTQAHIRTLLDLMKEGSVEEKWVVQQIPPGQLASLLHPIVDPKSTEGLTKVTGGISGSPGAAVGRVFFSADAVMEAHREALQKGEDTRLILCVNSSFAEDVKAIETGQGVIAVEGGYSSHAPVVARSMGKVALVNPDIKYGDKQFELDGQVIKEGDYVTMDVPIYTKPTIIMGKADLIKPDIQSNGLVDFIQIIRKFVSDDFLVRANADLGRDAKVARQMGAYGIGLCRTEHMFFAEDRINRFREMILAESLEDRQKALDDLRPLQVSDFYDLFKTMAPYHVTIRLLDAPLHEFLPRTPEMLAAYYEYVEGKGGTPDKKRTEATIERLHEFNPMLGHRGCRVAITYPEIYEMQVRAIFEAAGKLKSEGIEVVPEIMIPLIMNPNELRMIRNGKRIEGKYINGISDIARDYADIPYKVGTMIELPAAALLSDELARYAEFFSYGTNDLTQTTNGLSRDDSNSFFPVYTEFDLLAANPFQVLGQPVKELIGISARRGKLSRPDLKTGLCGEHGADPENIAFCKAQGLDYVSCSPYSVPIALLAVAQLNLNNAG